MMNSENKDEAASDNASSPAMPKSKTAANVSGQNQKISIVLPPSLSPPKDYPHMAFTRTLPTELLDDLGDVFVLHVLVMDPKQVLPPGKSLLSVLSRPYGQKARSGESQTLQSRVEDIVRKAFWSEALDSLSNSDPSIQLPRLKALYEDIVTTLKPLLPPQHVVLTTFSSPLSPTSSPLLSTISHLREAVAALRERCAPIRDSDVDAIARQLNSIPSNASTAVLASRVIDTVKSIFKVAEVMKDDLSEFVLGSMTEKQLKAHIASEAKKEERRLTLQLWPAPKLQELWDSWLAELKPDASQGSTTDSRPRHAWFKRLMQAFAGLSTVVCPLPGHQLTPNGPDNPLNLVPPPFFFTCAQLYNVQNFMGALAIAAALRTLVRLPPQQAVQSDPESHGVAMGFMERIWALLEGALDPEPGTRFIKITNLADEVIQFRKKYGLGEDSVQSPEEEARLRAAVARIIRVDDPVYVLLFKRLSQALAARLESSAASSASYAGPTHLQTGQDRPAKRPRLAFVVEEPENGNFPDDTPEPRIVVKGYEDEVLVQAVGELYQKLKNCVRWTEWVWPDLTGTGRLKELDSKP